jgi:APA family basic amino acid/polyamine antiporter
LALLIGGVIVAALYILVSMIFVNTLPYSPEAYRAESAPLTASARMFLPPWAVAFLGFGAVTAGLTSLNAAAVALPRELFAQSRDGILPAALSRVAPHAHTPLVSVTVFFAIAAALLLIRMDEEFYGLMAAVGIQLITAAIGLGSLRLSRKFPLLYRGAYVTFPMWLLAACTSVTVFVTIGFLVIVFTERWSVFLSYLALVATLSIYHVLRVARLRAAGVEFDRIVQSVPGTDEAENGINSPKDLTAQESEAGP